MVKLWTERLQSIGAPSCLPETDADMHQLYAAAFSDDDTLVVDHTPREPGVKQMHETQRRHSSIRSRQSLNLNR